MSESQCTCGYMGSRQPGGEFRCTSCERTWKPTCQKCGIAIDPIFGGRCVDDHKCQEMVEAQRALLRTALACVKTLGVHPYFSFCGTLYAHPGDEEGTDNDFVRALLALHALDTPTNDGEARERPTGDKWGYLRDPVLTPEHVVSVATARELLADLDIAATECARLRAIVDSVNGALGEEQRDGDTRDGCIQRIIAERDEARQELAEVRDVAQGLLLTRPSLTQPPQSTPAEPVESERVKAVKLVERWAAYYDEQMQVFAQCPQLQGMVLVNDRYCTNALHLARVIRDGREPPEPKQPTEGSPISGPEQAA